MEEYTQITIDEWQQWKEDIRRKLQESASNFVYIGYRLKQIRDSGMYDGCESIYEFAEKEYGLTRTVVIRFMAINDKFSKHGNSIELRDEFVGLNQSQLTEMLSLPVSDYDLVTESTSIKDIREIKKFEKEDMNEPEDAPEETAPEGECPLWTPLQKCVIDFFKDKRDLLDEILKMEDDKDIAEAMSPSGSTTHKKGIVLLIMSDYSHPVKYKLMGKPDTYCIGWGDFIDQCISEVFEKNDMSAIYPESAQKEPETSQKDEKIDIKPKEPEESVKKPQKTEKTEDNVTEEAAGEETTETTSEELPAAGNDDSDEKIRTAYREMHEIAKKIIDTLNRRDWPKMYILSCELSDRIHYIRSMNSGRVDEALNAEFDNE